MKEYYGTSIYLDTENILWSKPKQINVGELDSENLDRLEKEGFLSLLNIDPPMYTIISSYYNLCHFAVMFSLGYEVAASTDGAASFKRFILDKYDYTVDILNETNEDPSPISIPYIS